MLGFWNLLPYPIKHHQLKVESKTLIRALRSLDDCIRAGISPLKIQLAMANYQKVLSMPNFKFKYEFWGINVGLDDFFNPNRKMKDNLESKGVIIESWFKECVNGMEYLEEKYSIEVKDIYPEITAKLEKTWPGDDRFSIREKNILRKVAVRVHDFFSNIKDFKDDIQYDRNKPVSCADFVWRCLERRDFDFKVLPYWIQGENFFQTDLPMFLREIGYIVDKYDYSLDMITEQREREREERRLKMEEEGRASLCEADYL